MVFQARVNQTFSSTDDVVEITYDTVSTGAYTDIKPGMTVMIGTTAGGYEIGFCRARKAASATKIYIGRISELRLADNQYITVIKDFEIWAKHWLVTANKVFMDQDVGYSDQHSNCDPVPVMGMHAVVELTGASVSHSRDGSSSWVIGSTISGYQWAAERTGGGDDHRGDHGDPQLRVQRGGHLPDQPDGHGRERQEHHRLPQDRGARRGAPGGEDFQLNSCYGDYGSESSDYRSR